MTSFSRVAACLLAAAGTGAHAEYVMEGEPWTTICTTSYIFFGSCDRYQVLGELRGDQLEPIKDKWPSVDKYDEKKGQCKVGTEGPGQGLGMLNGNTPRSTTPWLVILKDGRGQDVTTKSIWFKCRKV